MPFAPVIPTPGLISRQQSRTCTKFELQDAGGRPVYAERKTLETGRTFGLCKQYEVTESLKILVRIGGNRIVLCG